MMETFSLVLGYILIVVGVATAGYFLIREWYRWGERYWARQRAKGRK